MAQEFKLIGDKQLLAGIHGLRGVAALSVILFHIVHLIKIKTPIFFNFIGRDFGYGVHLFFILSAFSLMYSTKPTLMRETWCLEYFVKRFFRIAPLFYFILIGSLFHRYISSMPTDKETLLLNFTLTFGGIPWTGVASGGWTIGVEVIFYILLPTLLLVIRSRLAALILVLFLIPISIVYRSTLDLHYSNYPNYTYNWSYFSFGPNMCFFGFGIYTFFLSRFVSIDGLCAKYLLPFFTLLILLSLMLTDVFSPLRNQSGRVDIILWGIGFSLLALWQSINPNKWFANWFLTHAGERSYSIYLLHPIIIQLMSYRIREFYDSLYPYLESYAFFVCAIPVCLVTIAVAELTYRYIEVPGIKFGQQINKYLRASQKA